MTAHLTALNSDTVLRKRLAKLMALRCFRNSKLEELHAGIVPGSAAGDYSDVRVVSPYGEIPWPQLSRLNDDEMRELMIDVVNLTYRFIEEFIDDERGAKLIEELRRRDSLPQWNEPQSPSLRKE